MRGFVMLLYLLYFLQFPSAVPVGATSPGQTLLLSELPAYAVRCLCKESPRLRL